MAEPKVVKRGRGRPAVTPEQRLNAPIIHFRVTAATYDALCRAALKEGIGIPEYLREILHRVLNGGLCI